MGDKNKKIQKASNGNTENLNAEISASSHVEKHGIIEDKKKGETNSKKVHNNIFLRKAVGAREWIRKVIDKKTGKEYSSKEK